MSKVPAHQMQAPVAAVMTVVGEKTTDLLAGGKLTPGQIVDDILSDNGLGGEFIREISFKFNKIHVEKPAE